MKKSILTLILLFTISTVALAQGSDYKLIEQTVSYYLEGGTNNDFETLKKAFHPDATMKFVSNDGYKEVNAIEFFKKVTKPGPKQDRETSIAYINVSGNTASAKLEINYATSSITDYMNLLKIDGKWWVVNKIYSRRKK